MATLDKTVYSGKQFESYVSIQSDALGTNDVSGTLYKIRTPEINDIDTSAGSIFADAVRDGRLATTQLKTKQHYKCCFNWYLKMIVQVVQ